MLLADLGAEVVRVDKLGPPGMFGGLPAGPLGRGRRSIGLDIKAPGGAEVVLRLAESCEALIEGFRPGVAERLGIGPDEVLARNPKIVYGRMTGWGQEGPLSSTAGHDINYLAITGLLHGIGPADRPWPPANYVADFGGGSMFLRWGSWRASCTRAPPAKARWSTSR
jgi:alpha-methylacyl-CoA racemase